MHIYIYIYIQDGNTLAAPIACDAKSSPLPSRLPKNAAHSVQAMICSC